MVVETIAMKYGLFTEGGTLFLNTVGPHTHGLPVYETSDDAQALFDIGLELITEDVYDTQYPGGLVGLVHCGCSCAAEHSATRCEGTFFVK